MDSSVIYNSEVPLNFHTVGFFNSSWIMFPPISQLRNQYVSTNTSVSATSLHYDSSYTMCRPK